MLTRFLMMLICCAVSLPAATLYTSRLDFEATLSTLLTDSYSPSDGYPAGFGIYNNATMTGFFGETAYQSTGFSDLNIVSGETYCAGCNGSFLLDFTGASLGDAQGVF